MTFDRVRDNIGVERRELRRATSERSDARGNDDARRVEDVTVDVEAKSGIGNLDLANFTLIDAGDGTPLKPSSVLDESLDGNRDRHRSLRVALEVLERLLQLRRADVAAVIRRAQQHADRRVHAPELQRLAEHARLSTDIVQVRGRGQSVRTRSDDRNVDSLRRHADPVCPICGR